jgi:hypothetical protein
MKIALYKTLKGSFLKESDRLSNIDKGILKEIFEYISKQYVEEQFYIQCQDPDWRDLFICMIIYGDRYLWDYPNEFNKIRLEINDAQLQRMSSMED